MTYRHPLRKPHVYHDIHGHKYIDGYMYLGRNRVPPMPNRISMIDRSTGEQLVLSHTGTSPALTIDLVAIDPRWSDVTRYGSHDGPYFDDYRLYLDSGTLSAEYAPGHGSQTILTRRSFETTVLKITVDPSDGSVVYTEYDL